MAWSARLATLRTWAVPAITILAGCERREYSIPPADGPLVLELRYPTARPVAVTDSISLWGTVGSGKASLKVNGRRIHVEANGGFADFIPLPPGDTPTLELEASKGGEVLRRSVAITRIRTTTTPPAPLHAVHGWVRLRRLPSDTMDSATRARPAFARWTPGGALALPLPLGIRLPAELESDSAVRVRLARGVVVWVLSDETEPVAAPRETPARVGRLNLSQTTGRSALEFDAAENLASTVDGLPTHIRWTLFGAKTGAMQPLKDSTGLVRRVTLRDMQDGRVVINLTLAGPLLGWRTFYRNGRIGLELRPLAAGPSIEGLVVALDPGHPPEGAIGPTGLAEDSLTLAVALEAANRLRALGARPVLTRSSSDPVSLEARVAIAQAADAELFVSIHANAPGDGRPPSSVDGTRIYWWNPHAFGLAKALRDSVPVAMGQQRVGTLQSNLAVLRPTWFPAALVEATALTLPIREALLRSPQGVERYAAGIVGGIQAWQAGRVTRDTSMVSINH